LLVICGTMCSGTVIFNAVFSISSILIQLTNVLTRYTNPVVYQRYL
jgi:hypothetical protein